MGKLEREIRKNMGKICVKFTSSRRWNVSTFSKRFCKRLNCFKNKVNQFQIKEPFQHKNPKVNCSKGFYIYNQIWNGSPATESIKSSLESSQTRQNTEQQVKDNPAEFVDNDTSGFCWVKFPWSYLSCC